MGCVPYSIREFIERQDADTNQQIVQMIYLDLGRHQSHWYYRSDQFIASKFGPEGTDYTGGIFWIPPEIRPFYVHFKKAEKPTAFASNAIDLGFKTYEEYITYLKRVRILRESVVSLSKISQISL